MRHSAARHPRRSRRGAVETRRSGHRRLRPDVRLLEGRILLSTFTVTSTSDDGSEGTLRWAVGHANATADADTIEFDSSFDTPRTISLTSGQLEFSDTTGETSITGPSGSVTISGGGLSRVFQVDASVRASISGL